MGSDWYAVQKYPYFTDIQGRDDLLISFIRTILLYIVVIVAMRLLGKRQIGELEPSELAITILISELAAIPMQDSAQPLATGLVPIVVLLALGLLTSILTVASPFLRRVIFGKPSIIIENGKMNQREIRRLRLSVDELAEELRLKDVTNIQTVKFGIVETNGRLSIILNDGDAPVTRRDMKIHIDSPSPLPYTIIANGRLLRSNVKKVGLSQNRIENELQKRNISRVSDVFYMSCDTGGNIRVIKNE